MKMSFSLAVSILLGVIAVSSVGHAGGFRDAARICESMDFQSTKNSCFSLVRSHDRSYFDRGAIRVCESMSFDSGKLECVSIIANKTYERFETDNCAQESFDSNKNSCLESSGGFARRW